MVAADDLCRGIAGYGLRGTAMPLPQETLDGAAWHRLLEEAVRQRITGHLALALEEDAFAATDSQRTAASEAHERALGLDLLLERLLVASVGELQRAGIPVRVLKGAALAHTVYRFPSLRSFGDVDLLVPGSHYETAIETLCAGGGRRRYREPRAGFDRRFGKGVCVEMPGGFEVDLHRSFVAGPFGLAVATDDLFGTGATFRVADRVLECLDLEARLVHACFHAALGSAEPRLVPLRDVAEIVVGTDVDADRVRALCARWRCGIVVQRAMRVAWDTFALSAETTLVEWARSYEPTSFERRALRAYIGPGRSYARQALAGFQAVRGARAKAAYARALLAPDPAYVHERDGSYLRRFARAARLLVDERTTR